MSSEEALEHVRRLLTQPRPFTAARFGVLSLLTDLLEHNGHGPAAQRLYATTGPLVAALEAASLRHVPAALEAITGRPPNRVAAALTSSELSGAIRHGLELLAGDDRHAACAELFSPDPSGVVLAGVRSAPAVQERAAARLLRDVWRRAGEIDAARRGEHEGAGDHEQVVREFRTLVEPRAVSAAARVLAPPFMPGKLTTVPDPAGVSKPRRYGNRVAAACATLAVARLPEALRGAGWERALEACAVLAAVADAVDVDPGRPRRVEVSPSGAPVRRGWWATLGWWPVLSSWGGASGDQRTDTAWRMSPAEADALIVASGWAMAIIGGCASLPSMHMTSGEVADHLASTTDVAWAGSAQRGWELHMSTRKAPDRAPWPVGYPASWSSWHLDRFGGLPWSLTAGEGDGAAEVGPEPAPGLEVEPDAGEQVRMLDADEWSGLVFTRREHGWVMDDDPVDIGTSWAELRETAQSRGGRLVTA